MFKDSGGTDFVDYTVDTTYKLKDEVGTSLEDIDEDGETSVDERLAYYSEESRNEAIEGGKVTSEIANPEQVDDPNDIKD